MLTPTTGKKPAGGSNRGRRPPGRAIFGPTKPLTRKTARQKAPGPVQRKAPPPKRAEVLAHETRRKVPLTRQTLRSFSSPRMRQSLSQNCRTTYIGRASFRRKRKPGLDLFRAVDIGHVKILLVIEGGEPVKEIHFVFFNVLEQDNERLLELFNRPI